jgi:hypothetical protein
VDWLRRALDDPPVESLPDETLLTICDATFGEADQEALTSLLDGHREGSLSDEDKGRLNANSTCNSHTVNNKLHKLYMNVCTCFHFVTATGPSALLVVPGLGRRPTA